MIRIATFMLLVWLLSGCSSPQSHSEISQETQKAVNSLRVGMNEAEALDIMRPVSLDWGRVYYGGTGAGRLYFQISDSRQLWLDSGGALSNWKVTGIGALEPKTKWTHFRGDSITVQ